MVSPIKVSFKIYQGSTFTEVLRWESSTIVYKPISAIAKTAPVQITATDHGLPNMWRFKVNNVVGMKEINSTDYYISSNAATNTVEINNVNALGFTAYTSGGVLEYNMPTDLSSYSARMQLRAKLDSTEILLELNTANGGIVIDNVNKTITINITAVQTTELNFASCVYSLELYTVAGVVVPFANGVLTLVKEVTR